MVKPVEGGKLGNRERDFEVVVAELKPSKFTGPGGEKKNQIHLILKDLKGDWKDQQEWYSLSNTEPSAFWDFAKQLIKLKVITATAADEAKDVEELVQLICDKLIGYHIHFKEERMGRKINPAWFPELVIKEPSKKK